MHSSVWSAQNGKKKDNAKSQRDKLFAKNRSGMLYEALKLLTSNKITFMLQNLGCVPTTLHETINQ